MVSGTNLATNDPKYGDIMAHYSAPKFAELVDAAERVGGS